MQHSHGGRAGHLVRRAIHLGMAAIPWVWYGHSDVLERLSGLPPRTLVMAVLAALIVLEALRVWRGVTLFGMRAYEARQVSAVAWGGFSLGLVLLFAPRVGLSGAALGAPIIVTLALVDPLMGELRRAGCPPARVAAAGVIVAGAVWVAAAHWLGAPFWLAAVMAPLSVAAEWPRLRWIDDNATLTLVPLAACLLLQPWIP